MFSIIFIIITNFFCVAVAFVDGARFTLTSSVPCRLETFWGVKIAEVYPIIYSPWPSVQDHATFKQSLCDISQHNEDFEL